jgi:hypothetical protein
MIYFHVDDRQKLDHLAPSRSGTKHYSIFSFESLSGMKV